MGQKLNDSPEHMLEKIIEDFSDDIFYCAYLHLNNRDLALDTCQQVLMKVYQNLAKFRKQSSYKTWIMRITVNTCISIRRSKSYREAQSEVQLDETLITEDFPAEQVERNLQYEHLWEQIQSLPQKYREVVILRYYRDYSIKEIAQILRLPQATTRTRLSRAQKLLRSQLIKGGAMYAEGH